jgi:hypothetical protein
MTIAVIILCLTLAYREIMFMHERKRWEDERKDLYSRIQAGSLQEYVQTTKEPKAPFVKYREQRISEEAADKGLMRQDLQYPTHWK